MAEELAALLQALTPNALDQVHALAFELCQRQAAIETFVNGDFMDALTLSLALPVGVAGVCAAVCRAWARRLSQDALVQIAHADAEADWKQIGLDAALAHAAVTQQVMTIVHGQAPCRQVVVRPSVLQKASLNAALLAGSDVACRGPHGSGQPMAMLLAALQLLSRESCHSTKRPSTLILCRDVHLDCLSSLCRKLVENLPCKIDVCTLFETIHENSACVAITTPKAALRELVQGHDLMRSHSLEHVFIYHCSSRLDAFGNEDPLSGVNTPIEWELGALLRLAQQIQGPKQVCIFGLSTLPGPSVQEVYKQWTKNPVLIGDWKLPSWMPQSPSLLTWQDTVVGSSRSSTGHDSMEQVTNRPNVQLATAFQESLSQGSMHNNMGSSGSSSCSASTVLRSEPQQEISALLAAHQYVRLLQQERGKTCWALVSREGQIELESHQPIIEVKLEEALAKTQVLCQQHHSLAGKSMIWAGLMCALEEESWHRYDCCSNQHATARSLSAQRPQAPGGTGSGRLWRKRAYVPEVVQQFDDVFARFNGRISEIIDAIASAVKGLPAVDPVHNMYRFCSTAAEQLGRERAFLCTFLQDSKIMQAQPNLMRRISEITGARKLLFGTSLGVGATGDVVVRGPGGLAGLLGLDTVGHTPLLPWEDLNALEDLEARAFSFNKGHVPLVREWYLLVTRLIDSIHTRIEKDLMV